MVTLRKPLNHLLAHACLSTSLVALAVLSHSEPARASETLAKSKNCVACHSVSTKIIGPAYKDIAKRYAGDESAPAKLAEKIVKGGSGVWGSVPMPSNAQVSEPEALALAKWILNQK